MAHQPDDDILGADYDPSYFGAGAAAGGAAVQSPIDRALALLKDPATMSGVETLFKESYKFIRLADDLHEIRWYLNDIRLCFVALTASGYVGILLYALILCLKRRRRGGGGGDGDGHHQNQYRGGGGRQQRSGSGRFENFDLESGGGGTMMTGAHHHHLQQHGAADWGDEHHAAAAVAMMPPPPPPNGTAIRTSDGYRYKPPNTTNNDQYQQQRQPSPALYHHQNQRLDAVDAAQVVVGPGSGKEGYPIGGGGVVISSPSCGSQHQLQSIDTGFIEKVK